MIDHASEAEIAAAQRPLGALRTALNQVLFGQEQLIEHVVTGVLAGGHGLLEGLPGLGKTQLVKGLAQALGLVARRLQFTPDLLPGDITGTPILEETDGQRRFVFHPGPLFANVVLADEINRASPKTQSALLEAMQERRVTVMGESHVLPDPFFVLATQNPIELEGTYPLPEAQLDRFLMKVEVEGVGVAVLERIIQDRHLGSDPDLGVVLTPAEVTARGALTRRVYLPEVVVNYIARLVDATHRGCAEAATALAFGASPRAAQSLAAAARARAILNGRRHASFEDVQMLARAVLQHRIVLTYDARLSGQTPADVIARLLEEVPAQDRELPRTLRPAAGG